MFANEGERSESSKPATAVRFEAKKLPGAGIIGAGSLVKWFIIISWKAPDSHIKRLRAALFGDATESDP